jgi:hypothetical protein
MYKNEETIKYNFLCNFYPHSNGGWIFFSKWFSLFSVYLSSNVCKTDLKTVKCCLKGTVVYFPMNNWFQLRKCTTTEKITDFYVSYVIRVLT